MPEDVKKEAEEKEVEEEGEIEESQDMSELLKKDLSELGAILSENPGIEQQVREVFDYHLKGDVDSKTYNTIFSSLIILIGEKAARVAIFSCKLNDNTLFDFLYLFSCPILISAHSP